MLRVSTRTEDYRVQQQIDEIAKLRTPQGQWGYNVVYPTNSVLPLTVLSTQQDEWRMNNGGVITVPYRGIYLLNCAVFWTDGVGSGERYVDFLFNGLSVHASERRNSPGPGLNLVLNTFIMLSAGDRFQVRFFQNSGGNLTVAGTLTVGWMGGLSL